MADADYAASIRDGQTEHLVARFDDVVAASSVAAELKTLFSELARDASGPSATCKG